MFWHTYNSLNMLWFILSDIILDKHVRQLFNTPVALKLRVSAAGNKKIFCNLVVNEISIRRQIVEYNSAEQKYYGSVDFGNPFQDEDEERLVAKEAIVFLLNAVNDRFKIPVAYYFVNGLNTEEKRKPNSRSFNVPSWCRCRNFFYDIWWCTK